MTRMARMTTRVARVASMARVAGMVGVAGHGRVRMVVGGREGGGASVLRGRVVTRVSQVMHGHAVRTAQTRRAGRPGAHLMLQAAGAGCR